MANKSEIQELAESLFVEQGLNAKTVAEKLGKREGTISTWRRKYGWDRLRRENISAPHKIRQLLLGELEKISQGEVSSIDADALAKISKVVETLKSRTSPQTVISVFQEFDNWMSDQDPKMAVAFLDWHKKFIQHIISMHNDQ